MRILISCFLKAVLRWSMQLSYLSRSESLKLLKFSFPICIYELIDPHEATSDPYYKFVIHNLSINLFSAKHIKPVSQSGNWKLNPCLVNVSCKHLINNIAFYSFISLLCSILLPYGNNRIFKFLNLLLTES